MYPTGPDGYLASSRHRGFFEGNTMVDVCLYASVGMIFYLINIKFLLHVIVLVHYYSEGYLYSFCHIGTSDYWTYLYQKKSVPT